MRATACIFLLSLILCVFLLLACAFSPPPHFFLRARSAPFFTTAAHLFFRSSSAAAADGDLARGWGQQIAWRSLPEGLVQAQSESKPLMLLVWKTWCGACKALRPKFEASSAVLAESSNFVMVNVVDDEEPADAMYKPGGAGYIPRVLFLRPDGSVMTDVQSGNEQYKCVAPPPPPPLPA
jgi:protein-disulfide reductase (glutathione)